MVVAVTIALVSNWAAASIEALLPPSICFIVEFHLSLFILFYFSSFSLIITLFNIVCDHGGGGDFGVAAVAAATIAPVSGRRLQLLCCGRRQFVSLQSLVSHHLLFVVSSLVISGDFGIAEVMATMAWRWRRKQMRRLRRCGGPATTAEVAKMVMVDETKMIALDTTTVAAMDTAAATIKARLVMLNGNGCMWWGQQWWL